MIPCTTSWSASSTRYALPASAAASHALCPAQEAQCSQDYSAGAHALLDDVQLGIVWLLQLPQPQHVKSSLSLQDPVHRPTFSDVEADLAAISAQLEGGRQESLVLRHARERQLLDQMLPPKVGCHWPCVTVGRALSGVQG